MGLEKLLRRKNESAQSYHSRIDEIRLKIIEQGTSREFYDFCQSCDYTPNSDIESELYQKGQADVLWEEKKESELLEKMPMQKARKKRKEPAKRAKLLYEFARQYKLNTDDIFADIPQKIDLLQKAGYRTLNGPKNKQVPLYLAKESRIGQMFRNTYHSVESYLSQKDKK